MPAVNAIANAPQKVTRRVGLANIRPAGPRTDCAEQAKKDERRNRHARDEGGSWHEQNHRERQRRPAKVDAEVSAAWTGRAVVASEMPSSSRACAPSASFAISWSATWRASSGLTPRSMYLPRPSSSASAIPSWPKLEPAIDGRHR
jgi:hypothetical protein